MRVWVYFQAEHCVSLRTNTDILRMQGAPSNQQPLLRDVEAQQSGRNPIANSNNHDTNNDGWRPYELTYGKLADV